MQSCPAAHWLCEVHWGFASAGLAQYPAGEQTSIRTSIAAHWAFVEHVYSQKPPTHAWAEAALQSLVWVQSGVGAVFGWHAPWLQ
jgi:uncharacterized MAPEG superfamily protein